MNSRRLWNSHQRHKFLWAEASRDILKFSLENAISRGLWEVFSDAMLFRQNTCKPGNNAVEMSPAFHKIARFERFTDVNLLKYVFNIIQNWETNALKILFDAAYFLLAVMVEGD